ncbi:MAG: hypothetical protein ACYDEX_19105 [Mobilitalea sp.]
MSGATDQALKEYQDAVVSGNKDKETFDSKVAQGFQIEKYLNIGIVILVAYLGFNLFIKYKKR